MHGPLIRAENLSVGFPIGKGLFDKFVLKAVDDVTLQRFISIRAVFLDWWVNLARGKPRLGVRS